MEVLVIKKINGFDIEAELNGKPINLKNGKNLKETLKVGVEYKPIINEKGGVKWLNSVKEIKDKKLTTPFESMKESKSTYDIKQLLIVAQSCQHDATQIISTGIDFKDYGSVEELAGEIIKLRDVLVIDLINKYGK